MESVFQYMYIKILYKNLFSADVLAICTSQMFNSLLEKKSVIEKIKKNKSLRQYKPIVLRIELRYVECDPIKSI